jgi:hypothetical protein
MFFKIRIFINRRFIAYGLVFDYIVFIVDARCQMLDAKASVEVLRCAGILQYETFF